MFGRGGVSCSFLAVHQAISETAQAPETDMAEHGYSFDFCKT